jgi:hypothetical protein
MESFGVEDSVTLLSNQLLKWSHLGLKTLWRYYRTSQVELLGVQRGTDITAGMEIQNLVQAPKF